MTRMALLLTTAATAAVLAVVDAQPAGPTSPDSTPCYQEITDHASLTQRVEGRLERAQQLLDRLVALKGKQPSRIRCACMTTYKRRNAASTWER